MRFLPYIDFRNENPVYIIVLHTREQRSVLLCGSRTLLKQHLTKLMQCVCRTHTDSSLLAACETCSCGIGD